jgi:hypothetical protein
MQTGQNSIAPEISLPQLGQVRWGSVLMDLTVHGPQSELETTACSSDCCEIGKCGPPGNLLLRSTDNSCSFILADQFRFRNKITSVGVLRHPLLITAFGHGADNISQRVLI